MKENFLLDPSWILEMSKADVGDAINFLRKELIRNGYKRNYKK